MSDLRRTDLTTTQKAQFAAAAFAGQGERGTVTELSRDFGVSRPTVYAAGATAERVLVEHFGAADEGVVWVRVDEAQVRRAVVALRVMGVNSIRAIEELLSTLYPDVRRSYGTIQAMLVEAQERAEAFNASLDFSAVKSAALDEMFSQGEPVLAGVDLDSGALLALEVHTQRDAKTWSTVLEGGVKQGLSLDVVVKDAAAGIAAAVRSVFPQAEQRDDCFHALYEVNKLCRRLLQSAYSAIGREADAQQALAALGIASSGERARAKMRELNAGIACTDAIAQFERCDAALALVRGAIECVDLERGTLREPEQVQALVEQAATLIGALSGDKARELAGYLRNRAPGLSLAQASLRPKLDALGEQYGEEAVVLGCIIAQRRQVLTRHRLSPAQYQTAYRHLLGAYSELLDRLGRKDSDEMLEALDTLLVQRHRASSAVEGFNATLRPFLYVHKGVNQGFLELFRARYNLRTRRWGRYKKTSAYELLTGTPVKDWLSVLGYPPSGSATVH